MDGNLGTPVVGMGSERGDLLVDLLVVVEPGVALARVEAPGEWDGEFPEQTVVGHA